MPALVIAATSCPESDEAVVWLQEAYTLAERCGDAMEMLDASVGLNNLHQARGEYAAIVDTAAERGRKLIQAGAPSAGQFLLTAAGGFALTLGRWADAEDHVRPALACAEGGHREASARSVMAVLCARRGDLHQGEQHLARAAEVAATHYMGTGTYPFGRAELALAQNRPDQALEVITQEMPAAARGDPRDADELLLLAARAAADLAQDARDQRLTNGTQRAEALFDRVLTARTSRTTEVFIAWSPQDHIQIARSALYNAELARLRNDPDLSLAWAAATQLCHTAGLLWEEAAAACHQARATLAEGLPRHQAATALRHGSSIAAHLGAKPLLLELQGTAAAAHISLDEVAPPSALRISEAGGRHTVFTPREQEVLAYVVAGRSNTEIARELFISDKTVSVHISNILRKTGAQTRVQAAAWASRQNHPPSHVRNEDI